MVVKPAVALTVPASAEGVVLVTQDLGQIKVAQVYLAATDG